MTEEQPVFLESWKELVSAITDIKQKTLTDIKQKSLVSERKNWADLMFE